MIAASTYPAPRLRVEPRLLEGLVAPLDLELVLRRLATQPDLHAPAKLVLSESGVAGLLTELPHDRDRKGVEVQLRRAIDLGLAWLGGEPLAPKGEPDPEALGAALAELPWPTTSDGAGQAIDVAEEGVRVRVRVEPVAGGALRVEATSSIPIEAPGAEESLRRFALEATGRIRLARLSVVFNGGTARIIWDAVVPGAPVPPGHLLEAVLCVVGARDETLQSLRALGRCPVAEAYTRLRNGRAVNNKCVTNGAGRHSGEKGEAK
ncbi:MAG: hypothetical protein V3T14_00430 [Myxococcota bacterium]